MTIVLDGKRMRFRRSLVLLVKNVFKAILTVILGLTLILGFMWAFVEWSYEVKEKGSITYRGNVSIGVDQGGPLW